VTKFKITAPVYDKWVRKSGDHIYKKGDQWMIRFSGTHTSRKYTLMWRGNHVFQSMSEYFKDIIPSAVEEWRKYKEYIGNSRSPRNPYLKNNIQIMFPDLPGTQKVSTISSPPQYPDMPSCFYAAYDNDLDGICYSWLDTYEFETIIEAGYYNSPGRVRPPIEWMRIGKGDLSGSEKIFLEGKNFCANSITYASIRSINLRGEVSDWTKPIAIDIGAKPTVDFFGIPRSGEPDLFVEFTSEIEGEVLSYLWTFGDGNSSELEHPSNTYSPTKEYFTVKLTAFGVAGSKKSKTRYDYIRLTPSDNYGNKIYICDTWNHRIFKRETSNLDYISKIGSYGTGNDNFNRPFDCAVDDTHLFVVDKLNHRIVKRLKSDLSYDSKIGSLGSGNDQFSSPSGITLDTTHLYIWDYNNQRIHKRLKSDLSLVSFLNSIPSGNSRFKYGHGLCVDNENLYVLCEYYDAIITFRKLDFSFVHRLDNTNFIGGTLNNPKSILVDNMFIWFVNFNYPSYSIYQLYKLGYTLYHHYDLITSSEQYSFFGLAATKTHILYMDPFFNKCSKRLRKDFKKVKEIGTEGSGNDQFNKPMGCTVRNPYSFE